MRYRFAEFLLDRELGTLTGPEGEVRLRPQTLSLLEVLVENAPRILSTDALIDQGWSIEHVSVAAIRQAISELRQALGDSASSPRIVETVHRRGYRLIAPVERLGVSPEGRLERDGLAEESVDSEPGDSEPGDSEPGDSEPGDSALVDASTVIEVPATQAPFGPAPSSVRIWWVGALLALTVVLVGSRGRNDASKPMFDLKGVWRRVKARAELPERMRLYDATRHTFISTALELELSLDRVKILAGHAVGGDITARYTHYRPDRLLVDADRVAGELASAMG